MRRILMVSVRRGEAVTVTAVVPPTRQKTGARRTRKGGFD